MRMPSTVAARMRRWVVQPRNVGERIAGRRPAQDRDPVIGLLAGKNAVVTGLQQFSLRETVVGQLGLLERQDIGAGSVGPGQNVG